jgi:hypothetical protein
MGRSDRDAALASLGLDGTAVLRRGNGIALKPRATKHNAIPTIQSAAASRDIHAASAPAASVDTGTNK